MWALFAYGSTCVDGPFYLYVAFVLNGRSKPLSYVVFYAVVKYNAFWVAYYLHRYYYKLRFCVLTLLFEKVGDLVFVVGYDGGKI